MNIVHYSLGLPPFRGGGMTKFVLDLMIQQKKNNNSVCLLWPGEFSLLHKDSHVKKCKEHKAIENYRIINSNPVSYDEGIIEINNFINEGNLEEYLLFFDLIKPDILHIHTFMGLQKNMLVAAKLKNIRVIYSSHDFFLLCPKLTMFRNNKICDCVKEQTHCDECNQTALSIKQLMLLQSNSYRLIKENSIVKYARKKHRNNFLNNKNNSKTDNRINNIEKYHELRKYYYSLLDYVDCIHYNSKLSKRVYEKYIGERNNVIINLSHLDITDNRKIKEFENKIRITYLGNQSSGKGYFLLIDVLDKLYKEKEFELNITFTPEEERSYINIFDQYDYKHLEQIFDKTDVLIAPSLFYDTFGFVVPEAISYGVPVIISNNVGAIDVVKESAGIVFDSNDNTALYNVLKNLTAEKLKDMNDYILENNDVLTIDDVEKSIMEKCYIDDGRY